MYWPVAAAIWQYIVASHHQYEQSELDTLTKKESEEDAMLFLTLRNRPG